MSAERLLLVAGLALLITGVPGRSGRALGATPVDPDQRDLRQAGIATDTASLLRFLRQRSADTADPGQVPELIRQLGERSFTKRERAARLLVALGRPALPALRQAQRDADAERARRAARCIRQIEDDNYWRLPLPAVRRLVARKPPEAVSALLGYLPFAPDDETAEEIWYGLDALAVRGGNLEPALVRALSDAVPVRRAAAACIAGHRGSAEQRAAVRRLLTDADATVRLRAAQGLLAAREAAGVPALIELLNQPELEIAWQAEELLHWVAGEGAPDAVVGSGPAARRRCREAWRAWWRGRKANPDVRTAGQNGWRPGLYLVVLNTPRGKPGWDQANRLALYGCDGRPRWQIGGLKTASGAAMLPGGQFLIGEWRQASISEADSDGKVTRRIVIPWPPNASRFVTSCGRLPNGNTVLTGSDCVAEISPAGKLVHAHCLARPGVEVTPECLAWLRNGCGLWAMPEKGQLVSLATVEVGSGREVERVPLPHPFPLRDGLRACALRGGRYLITGDNRVCEIDGTGKTVWLYSRLSCGGLIRLRTGGTLVMTPLGRGMWRNAEVDRAGKIVWQAFLDDPGGAFVQTCLDLVRLGFDEPRPRGFDLTESVQWPIHGLKSRNPTVRRASAALLGELGPRATAGVPALAEALGDPDELVRLYAHDALAGAGGVIGPKASARRQAETFGPVLRLAEDRRPAVRAGALGVLWLFPSQGARVVPVLLEGLRDQNASVRRGAARGCSAFARDARLVEPLLLALKDRAVPEEPGEMSVADNAAVALGRGDPADKRIVAGLLEAYETDEGLRGAAANALAWMGTGDGAAARVIVARLAADLRDRSRAALWLSTVSILRNIGPKAKGAVPILTEMHDRYEHGGEVPDEVARAIPDALRWIGPAAVSDLIHAVRDRKKPPEERAGAALALADSGTTTKGIERALRKALLDDDPRVRAAAGEALRRWKRRQGDDRSE
jgi:HEAT repeat protein